MGTRTIRRKGIRRKFGSVENKHCIINVTEKFKEQLQDSVLGPQRLVWKTLEDIPMNMRKIPYSYYLCNLN